MKTIKGITKNKDTNIETLRGVAIILMVLGHAIGQLTLSGIKLKEDSWWLFSSYAFQYIRMPLFTIISGYVYAFKPLSRFPTTTNFIIRKLERLLVPFLVVVTLSYLLRYFTPGLSTKVELSGIWDSYLYPTGQFWFIQGMIIMFLIFICIEKLNWLQRIERSLLTLLFCISLFFLNINTHFLSLDKVPFLLTFFVVGVVLKRFKTLIFTRKNVFITTVILCLALAFQMAIFNNANMPAFVSTLLTVVVGITASIFLIYSRFTNTRLIWLGNFSYGIYLFHMFGISGFRLITLKILHITNPEIHIIGGLICGLAFPVILELIIPNRSVLSLLFFGNQLKPKTAKVEAHLQ